MAARENAFHTREVWWHSKRFDDEVKSLCSNILYYMMVACSRLQDMQKRVGLVKGRAGPLLPQITRVNFAWLVFAACTVFKSLAPPANMMVTVKLTIIYY